MYLLCLNVSSPLNFEIVIPNYDATGAYLDEILCMIPLYGR